MTCYSQPTSRCGAPHDKEGHIPPQGVLSCHDYLYVSMEIISWGVLPAPMSLIIRCVLSADYLVSGPAARSMFDCHVSSTRILVAL